MTWLSFHHFAIQSHQNKVRWNRCIVWETGHNFKFHFICSSIHDLHSWSLCATCTKISSLNSMLWGGMSPWLYAYIHQAGPVIRLTTETILPKGPNEPSRKWCHGKLKTLGKICWHSAYLKKTLNQKSVFIDSHVKRNICKWENFNIRLDNYIAKD